MSLAIRRKAVYVFTAVLLAVMLAGPTLTAPVFADCTTTNGGSCGG